MNHAERGGPAFPVPSVHMGMTLRQWYVGQIISGLVVGCSGILGKEEDGSPHFSAYAHGPCNDALAKRAHALADALIREGAAT